MKVLLILGCILVQQCLAQYGGNAPNPYGAPAKPANAYESPVPAPVQTPSKTGYGGDEVAEEAAGAGFEEPTTPSTTTTTEATTTTTKSPFPLPECFINDDGFLCCNKELEKLMSDTYESLSKSRNGNWKKCNRHQVTLAIQRAAEPHFNHKFEVVTGAGDYASKNNFDADLICKIKREKSIILAYGTPTFT